MTMSYGLSLLPNSTAHLQFSRWASHLNLEIVMITIYFDPDPDFTPEACEEIYRIMAENDRLLWEEWQEQRLRNCELSNEDETPSCPF
jgi:hypothetical protein